MDSEEEDAVLSRRRLCCEDTLETVVAWYGEDSWPEAGCGPSSRCFHIGTSTSPGTCIRVPV